MTRSLTSTQPVIATGHALRKSSEGRQCEEPGCITKLSVYNSSRVCWQHQEVVYVPNRGGRNAN